MLYHMKLSTFFFINNQVYCPYLLMAKKRYAGVYWTNPEKYDKVDTKGIEK